jgi:hypothetical protein
MHMFGEMTEYVSNVLPFSYNQKNIFQTHANTIIKNY